MEKFIVTPMSETYQSKRESRQRMLENLPVGLREHVSLRNVEAVAALSPQAQMRLLEAIQAGLTRLNLSARAYYRILKLSRTIVDLAGSAEILFVQP